MALTGGGIPLLVDRTADAATNSETQILLRSVDNPELRIVMTVAECDYRIVARRSAGIRRLVDLRGKRVGTPANTSAEYYLSKMLRTVKLDEPDVTVVAMPVADMAAAMKRGDVDAVSGWEPGAQDSMAALGADAIVFQDRSVYRELFNLNTTAGVLSRRSGGSWWTSCVRLPRRRGTFVRVRRMCGRFCRRASTCPRPPSPPCGVTSDSRRRCHPTLSTCLSRRSRGWPPGRSVRRAPARNCRV
jgi:hypothetical protein